MTRYCYCHYCYYMLLLSVLLSLWFLYLMSSPRWNFAQGHWGLVANELGIVTRKKCHSNEDSGKIGDSEKNGEFIQKGMRFTVQRLNRDLTWFISLDFIR